MGPLKGIKIVEFSGIGPGPFCGMLLADLGADVIRISRKDAEGMENKFDIHNRSKRTITADLKNKESVDEILKLTNLAENYNASELTDQCLVKNKKKTLTILNENNTSPEENILILKTFLYKLKRLKKIKIELEINNNPDTVISSYKPPIFWKDKDLVKQQLKIWSLPQIKSLIKRINNIELLIKKNSQIASQILNDFILEKLKQPNN